MATLGEPHFPLSILHCKFVEEVLNAVVTYCQHLLLELLDNLLDIDAFKLTGQLPVVDGLGVIFVDLSKDSIHLILAERETESSDSRAKLLEGDPIVRVGVNDSEEHMERHVLIDEVFLDLLLGHDEVTLIKVHATSVELVVDAYLEWIHALGERLADVLLRGISHPVAIVLLAGRHSAVDGEVRLEVGEPLDDPVFVVKTAGRVAQKVEYLSKLGIGHANFRVEKTCLEAINVEHAVPIVVLHFKVLDELLSIRVDYLEEVSQ